MFNKKLFNKLEEKFPTEDMAKFSEMVSEMYKLLHEDVLENDFGAFTEYNFEQEWWNEKYKQLIAKV